jgi:hypothetical protein
MKRNLVLFATFLLSLGSVFTPQDHAQDQNPSSQNESEREHPPRIGDMNYVEGQATLDGQPIHANSVGTAVMGQGQTLLAPALFVTGSSGLSFHKLQMITA